MTTEQDFNIPTADGTHRIYGTLNRAQNTSAESPCKRLVVMCHGLSGSPNEYLNKIGQQQFNKAGFDVVRFAFYDYTQKARSLVDCTLAIHAEDLQSVVAHFSENYNEIFLTGHSYGGITIMVANVPNISGISLWDATFNYSLLSEGSRLKQIPGDDNLFSLDWGVNIVLGREMVEESTKMDGSKCLQLARRITAPTQMVLASEGVFHNMSPYYERGLINCEHERVVIEGADHCFDNGDTAYELAQNTIRWFNQHSQIK